MKISFPKGRKGKMFAGNKPARILTGGQEAADVLFIVAPSFTRPPAPKLVLCAAERRL
ncbi:hypothetical protein [Rhodocaloribacter sp.]